MAEKEEKKKGIHFNEDIIHVYNVESSKEGSGEEDSNEEDQ